MDLTTYKNNNYLQEYWDKIRSGEIPVCAELYSEIENLIKEIDSDEYIFDTREADLRISFIESCCYHVKAPYYGKPFLLDLWQKAYITVLFSFKIYLPVGINAEQQEVYAWVNRFNESLLLIQRKNGKTAFCAALALSDLALGKAGSSIAVASNDDNQSMLLYGTIDNMRAILDPKQRDFKRTNRLIFCKYNKSDLYRLSEKMKNLEGRNITRAYIDEVNMMPAESVVVNAIKQSTSIQPAGDVLIVYLTSEGFVVDGYLDNLMKKSRKISKREFDDTASKRFLPWIYKCDSEREVFDGLTHKDGWKIWLKANPSLASGVKKISYIREQLEAAQQNNITRAWVLCKDFGIKTSSAVEWLKSEWYSKPCDLTIKDFAGEFCIGGADLAMTTDLCALILRFHRNGKYYLYGHAWITQDKLYNDNDSAEGAKYKEWAEKGWITIVEDTTVDTALVAQHIAELHATYGIVPFIVGYDDKFSQQFKNASTGLFEIENVQQNAKTMHQANIITENSFRLGQFEILDNNEVVRWCLSNCAVKLSDSNGSKLSLIVKKDDNKAKKIDLAVAIIITTWIYTQHKSEFDSVTQM